MLSEMIRAYVFHLIAEACVLLVLSFIEVKHLTYDFLNISLIPVTQQKRVDRSKSAGE